MIYMSDYSVISHLFAWAFSTSLPSWIALQPGPFKWERARWSERGGGQKRDREADKVQVKVQGHLSPWPFITRESQRTLKRQEQKKKRARNKRKKSNYIQLISNQSQNKMKQCVERTWLCTKPSNQPEKKTDRCFFFFSFFLNSKKCFNKKALCFSSGAVYSINTQ